MVISLRPTPTRRRRRIDGVPAAKAEPCGADTVRGQAGVHVGLYALTWVVRIVRACQHSACCPPERCRTRSDGGVRRVRGRRAPRRRPTDDFSAPCWSVRRIPTYGELTRAQTDLRHEPEPGRLHRCARRRPGLERAERRAVPVVVRPGGGDRPGAVRAPTVGGDESPLA